MYFPSESDLAQNKTFSPIDTSLDKKAKAAMEQIGPRVYEIDCHGHETVRFFVIGCQGSGNNGQKKVAKWMDKIAKSSKESEPIFILGLGDNLYEDGATSPSAEIFNPYFHHVYGDQELTLLNKKPFFMMLGNHDRKQHNKIYYTFKKTLQASWNTLQTLSWSAFNKTFNEQYYSPKTQGDLFAQNEIAHSYLPEGDPYKNSADKINLYQNKVLDPEHLPQWNMPYYFYSLVTGDTQIFCLDSNTYAKDYLDLLEGRENPEKPNQAKWFKEEYEKAKKAGKKIIIAKHHPLYTCGKRVHPHKYDTHLYLSPEEELGLQQHLHCETRSYNEFLSLILKQQGIEPDLVLNAHDHFMSYCKKEGYAQATFGAGGDDDLQEQESVAEHPLVGVHIKEYGFGSISYATKNPENIYTDMHTIQGDHLRFSDKSHEPFFEKTAVPSIEEKYRERALELCNKHLTILAKKERAEKENKHPSSLFSGVYQAYSYVSDKIYAKPELEKIACLNKINTYFKNLTLRGDFKKIIDDIRKIIEALPDVNGNHALILELQQALLDERILKNQYDYEMESESQLETAFNLV